MKGLPALAIGIAGAALIVAVPNRDAGTEHDIPGLRLVGDWEPADSYLVGSHALWRETAGAVLEALEGTPTRVRVPGDDGESGWVRDYGPLAVERNGRLLWLDPSYYPDRPLDDAVPRELGALHGISVERLPVRIEGGAVASDGRGLCVMTSVSLSRTGTGPVSLRRRLGCEDLVVVPSLPGEPTGHVDQAIQFLGPQVVAVAELPEFDEAAGRLAATAKGRGRNLEVLRIPAYRGPNGEYLSYTNVVALPADRLLVPSYSAVPPDVQARAHEALRRASGRSLVAVPADGIAIAGGGLHCIVLGLHLS